MFRRRRRRSAQLAEENAKTYNIYTQRVSDVEATKRTLKYSYDDMLSNRSVTFDGGDCDTSHQCVQLEVIVSNFRPSLSADVVIDVTVELDLSEVGKWRHQNCDRGIALIEFYGIITDRSSLQPKYSTNGETRYCTASDCGSRKITIATLCRQ